MTVANPLPPTLANLVSSTVAILAAPTGALASNAREEKNSNFGLFYKHKGEKSHLVPLMYNYWSIDI